MAGSGGVTPTAAMPSLAAAAATVAVSEEELVSTQQFIENALDLKLKGNSTNYQYLIQQLAAPARPSDAAKSPRRKIFLALPRCISAMASEPQAFAQLFDVLFKFTFLDDRADVDAFTRFIVHLVSSNTVYVLPTLQMLARNLCRPQQLPSWLEPPPAAPQATAPAPVATGRISIGASFGGIVVAPPSATAATSASPPAEPIDVEARIAQRFASVHETLRRVLALVPTAANVLFPVLCEHVPHKRLAGPFQVAYLRNVLELSTYVPGLQERVLALVVDQLVAVDVEIKLDDSDEDVFTMDDFLDDDLLPPGLGGTGSAKLDEMADKLDDMMLTTFAHIERLVGTGTGTNTARDGTITDGTSTNESVDVHKAATVFRHLLKVFEHSVLNTHRSKYPQFLLFYICRLDPQFQDVLLSQLLATSLDPHVPPVTRHSCSAYLASFLARAKYIAVAYIQKALYHVLKWLHEQMDIYDALAAGTSGASTSGDTDGTDGLDDASAALAAEQAALEASRRGSFHESIFVSSLQTVCYVLCFRGLELAATPHGYDFLRSLGWQRLLRTPNGAFCPLALCQPTVATEFLNLAETLDLVSRTCIAELDDALSAGALSKTNKTNKSSKSMERSTTPSSATNLSGSGSGALLGPRQALETFFPFDPYLLRRSFKYIGPSYLYWKHADPTSSENCAALAAVKAIIRDFEAANGGHDDDNDEGDDGDDDDGDSSDSGDDSELSDGEGDNDNDGNDDNDDDVSMAGSVPATPSSSFKGLSYLEATMQQRAQLGASFGSSLDGGSLDDRDRALLQDGGGAHRKPSTAANKKLPSRSTFDPSPALSASSPPSRLPPLGSANAFTLGGFDDAEDDGF